MKTFISAIIYFILFQTYAQDDKVVSWINENAIKIEDANPDTNLSIFNNNIPKKFASAKIFGFGEAAHQGKEFLVLLQVHEQFPNDVVAHKLSFSQAYLPHHPS